VNDACSPWRDRLWGVLDREPEMDTCLPLVVEHLRGCPACRASFSEAVQAERLLFTAGLPALAATMKAPAPVAAAPPGPVTVKMPKPVAAGAAGAAGAATQVPAPPTTITVRRTPRTARRPALRRRRRASLSLVPWAAAAAVLMVGMYLMFTGNRTPAWMVVEEAVGLATGDGRAVQAGAAIAPGSSLSAAGPASLRLGDGTRLWLEADSRVVLESGGTLHGGGRAGVMVRLAHGAVGVSAKAQDPAAPLVVRTPLGEAVVVGTAFRVAHRPDGSELTVSSGTVRLVAADGSQRLVNAGGQARLAAVAPAASALVASFSATAVAGLARIDGELPNWPSGQGILALPPHDSARPKLRQLGSGHGLCFNGASQRLGASLPGVDGRNGVTMVALFIPIDQGRDQRVAALVDGGRERLALVRHDLQPGSVAVWVDGVERVRLPVPTGKHWAVACRWRSDGTVALNSAAGAGRSAASISTSGSFSAPQLLFAAAPDGHLLEGDLIAIEVHSGTLDDAALAARVRALAAANHFPVPTW
jgi:ferric-dicitrate binding protein FerR (iron transport regulator)